MALSYFGHKPFNSHPYFKVMSYILLGVLSHLKPVMAASKKRVRITLQTYIVIVHLRWIEVGLLKPSIREDPTK
jgi:hypothetical protein